MILPNKLIPFENSVIARLSCILDELMVDSQRLEALYERTKIHFDDINQYILTLDVLFTLGKIQLNKEARVILNVETNNV